MDDYELIAEALVRDDLGPPPHLGALAALNRLMDQRHQALLFIGKYVCGEPETTATVDSMRGIVSGQLPGSDDVVGILKGYVGLEDV